MLVLVAVFVVVSPSVVSVPFILAANVPVPTESEAEYGITRLYEPAPVLLRVIVGESPRLVTMLFVSVRVVELLIVRFTIILDGVMEL